MSLRSLVIKGYPPIMAVWGPLDFVNYNPEELRHLYDLLSQRMHELKAYLDKLEESKN